MRLFSIAVAGLLLTQASWAQEPPLLEMPRWEKSGSRLKLITPQAATSVYLLSSPDRLCVEFAGTRTESSGVGAPALAGVTKVRWHQPDMSHSVCEIGLAYQLPPQQIKWSPTAVSLELDFSWEDRFSVVPGVVWNRFERALAGRYLLWNELLVDPDHTGVELEIGLAKERTDSREKTSEMVKRLGAIAGVNGGYFAGSGGPLGVVYKGGKVISPHVGRRPPRTTLGVMKDRRIAMDQVVVQKNQLASRSGEAWSDVQLALGGGPRLLRRGQLALTTDEEELGPKGNDITRIAARTAVATTRNGKVMIVTASGYLDNHLHGLRLEELASELIKRGSSDAMNLDGGASTSMTVANQVVSYGPRAPRFEKPVATALLVKASGSPSSPARVELRSETPRVPADGTSTVEFSAAVRDAQGRTVPDGTVVRFYGERFNLTEGFAKTQGGVARVKGTSVTSVGNAKIWAECGAARDSCSLTLEPGAVKRLWSRLQPTAGKPGKFLLTVQAVDSWHNPVKGVPVQVGEGQQSTYGNGQCSFEINLPPGSPAGTLPVSCQGVTLTVPTPAVEAELTPTPRPTPAE